MDPRTARYEFKKCNGSVARHRCIPQGLGRPRRLQCVVGAVYGILTASLARPWLGALLRLHDDLTFRTTYEPLPRRNILTRVTADDDDRDLTPLREIVPVIEGYEIAADADRHGPMWGYIHEK